MTINRHTTVQQHRRKILLLRGEKITILEGEAKSKVQKINREPAVVLLPW